LVEVKVKGDNMFTTIVFIIGQQKGNKK
jgi:hypothetical protein